MKQIGIIGIILALLIISLFIGGIIFNMMIIFMKICLGIGVIGIVYLLYKINQFKDNASD